MTSFEFGITAAPAAPLDDWDDVFRAQPPAGDPQDRDEPPPCAGDCCRRAPQPDGGGLL